MKIEKWQMPQKFGKTNQRRSFWYFAILPNGFEGVGDTPNQAIADARHEYRQWKDNAEQGKCRKGLFHK